jgi:hypothetical protein
MSPTLEKGTTLYVLITDI